MECLSPNISSEPRRPHRVVLRLKTKDFENEHGSDAPIYAYLDHIGRPRDDIEKLYSHMELPQATSFHVVLDMNSDISVGDLDTLPHELYQIRRHDGKLIVAKYAPVVEKTMLTKMRSYTKTYRWGR